MQNLTILFDLFSVFEMPILIPFTDLSWKAMPIL